MKLKHTTWLLVAAVAATTWWRDPPPPHLDAGLVAVLPVRVAPGDSALASLAARANAVLPFRPPMTAPLKSSSRIARSR